MLINLKISKVLSSLTTAVRGRKNKRKVVAITVICISCLLLFYNIFVSGDLCHSYFPYKYPHSNIKQIIKDILENGHTTANPVNNISNEFQILHSVDCTVETKLVIIVKSFISNIAQREAIRSTWGNVDKRTVKVVYTLGYLKGYETIINSEHASYKDIIQGSFIDKYRNNIYKTVMAYNWITTNCASTNYIFFVDDDYFVNVPNILQFASKKMMQNTNVMFGYKQCSRQPVRDKNGKWYVSFDEYPFAVLPDFLSAGSVLTHINVVRKLQIAFPFIKPIYLDDVFVSITALKLEVELINEEKIDIHGLPAGTAVKYIIANHNYKKPRLLYRAWEVVE